jgi:glycosyltransferase involved in cell wall biosynthesis
MNELSVVLSVYKNDDPESFLRAVDSIMDQSRIPDEVIICVDGPVPENLDDAVLIADVDAKVKVYRLEKNIGLGGSRDYAIKQSRGTFIAVMDSDDFSLRNRFQLQLDLIKSKSLDVVGGYISEFSEHRLDQLRKVPLSHEDIFRKGKYRSPMNHVTVMFKRESYLASGGYLPIRGIEDYDLFHRMLISGYKFENIPEILVNVSFDESAIKRRAGLSYLKCWISLLVKMYQSKYLNLLQFATLLVVHTIAKLLPRRIIPFLYRFLRN